MSTPRTPLRRPPRRLAAVVLVTLLGVLGLAACGSGSEGGAAAADGADGRFEVRQLTLDRPIVDQGALRLVVHNGTARADRLVRVQSPYAVAASLHRSETDDQGRSTMRPIASLRIPPRSDVTFEPGGLHVMLIGIRSQLAIGNTLPVTFTFQRAGKITVEARVVAPGTTPTEHDHG